MTSGPSWLNLSDVASTTREIAVRETPKQNGRMAEWQNGREGEGEGAERRRWGAKVKGREGKHRKSQGQEREREQEYSIIEKVKEVIVRGRVRGRVRGIDDCYPPTEYIPLLHHIGYQRQIRKSGNPEIWKSSGMNNDE